MNFPELPFKGELNWYDKRQNFDDAVVSALNSLGESRRQANPTYYTRLQTPQVRIVQSFGRDPLTGEWYTFQAGPNQETQGDLTISRLSPSGAFLDKTILIGGGHGSQVAVEREGDGVWLWIWWEYDTTGTRPHKAVRWKYRPDATVYRDDPNIQDVPDFQNGTYTLFAIDQESNSLSTRVRMGNSEERFYLYSLSEYKSGLNRPLKEWRHGYVHDNPYQGHASDRETLWINKGGAEGREYPPSLVQFHWDTRTEIVHDTSHLGARSDGEFDFNESEGVCLWRAKDGVPRVLFGKAVGPQGSRRTLVFQLSEPLGGGSERVPFEISDGRNHLTLGQDSRGDQLYANKEVVYDRGYNANSPSEGSNRLVVMTDAGTLGTLHRTIDPPYLPWVLDGGVVSVSAPSGGGTGTANVTFSKDFPAPPAVTVSVSSTSTQFTRVRTANVTSSGFQIRLEATGGTSMPVHWNAFLSR